MTNLSDAPSHQAPLNTALSVVAPGVDDKQMIMTRELTRSLESFSWDEKWLLAYSVERIDQATLERISSSTNVGWKASVKVFDYATEFGVDTQTAFEQLKLAVSSLFERSVCYQTRDYRGVLVVHRLRWISSNTETRRNGSRNRSDSFTINFTPEVVSYLVNPCYHEAIEERLKPISTDLGAQRDR